MQRGGRSSARDPTVTARAASCSHASMTRARFLTRFVVVALVLCGSAAVVSCGDDDSQGPTSAAGMAGMAGMAAKPQPIMCGANTCNPLILPPPNTAAPCCTPDDTCGIDATPLASYGVVFTEACQPKNQPGDLDSSCPESPDLSIPTTGDPLVLTHPFKGCCHADTHTCGYMLDTLGGLFNLGLGCVDSAPFLDGGAPSACGSNGAAGSSN